MPDGSIVRPDPVAAVIGREHWVKGYQDQADPFRFVASTEDVDRMGDVVEAKGWKLANFKKNPIALWAHDSRSPIGTWTDITVEDGKLYATLQLAAHGTSPFLNTVRSLIEQRILRAVSVGFRPLKAVPLEGSKNGGVRYVEQELLEISVVAIPANSAALGVARSFDLPSEDMVRLFAASGQSPAAPAARAGSAASPPVTTKHATPITPKGTPANMKIADRLAGLEADLLSKRDALTALTLKDQHDEAETAQLDELPDEITAMEKSIASWRKAQAALAATAQPAGGTDPTQGVTRGTGSASPAASVRTEATVRKGRAADLLISSALIALRSHVERRSAEDILARDFGENTALETVCRAVTSPANSAVTGWAAELMDTVMGDFQDLLMPTSVWRRMNMTRLTFDNGKIRLPGRSARGLSGDFVAEGQPIPVKQTTFASVLLEPYKLAVITAMTRELAKYSNPAALPIIRQALVDDTSVTVDGLFLDATAAVATIRPAGLQATATGGNTRVSSGTTLANVITDLKAAYQTMMTLDMGRMPVWLMNSSRHASLALITNASGGFMFRDELMGGTLLGIPVIHSNTVPSSVVFLIDQSEIATAADIVPEIEISTEAALHMQSTPATSVAAGTGGTTGTVMPLTGGVDTPATPVRSLFQTYSMALRLVWPIDWSVRRAGAVQTITSVAW